MACNQFRSESCIASAVVSEAANACLVKAPPTFGSAPGDLLHSDITFTGNSEEPDPSWWDCDYGD
jgi:hypothetical protein